MTEFKRPPLGLLPRSIQDSLNRTERLRDIFHAIECYMYNDPIQQIPIEWINEYNELVTLYNLRLETPIITENLKQTDALLSKVYEERERNKEEGKQFKLKTSEIGIYATYKAELRDLNEDIKVLSRNLLKLSTKEMNMLGNLQVRQRQVLQIIKDGEKREQEYNKKHCPILREENRHMIPKTYDYEEGN